MKAISDQSTFTGPWWVVGLLILVLFLVWLVAQFYDAKQTWEEVEDEADESPQGRRPEDGDR